MVVAHRLPTARRAMLSLALNDRCILERGTHQALLAPDGLSARLSTRTVEDLAGPEAETLAASMSRSTIREPPLETGAHAEQVSGGGAAARHTWSHRRRQRQG